MANIFRPFAGSVLAAKALEVVNAFAESDSIRESHGPNRSPQIDKIESLFGMTGEPYCAMGAMFCYAKALCFLADWGTETPALQRALDVIDRYYIKPSPSCSAIRNDARARGIWVPRNSPGSSDPHFGPAYQKPGDLILYNFSGKADARGEHVCEHIGIFNRWTANAQNQFLSDVEWNTGGPRNTGAQADGDGCYQRNRTTALIVGTVAIHAVK